MKNSRWNECLRLTRKCEPLAYLIHYFWFLFVCLIFVNLLPFRFDSDGYSAVQRGLQEELHALLLPDQESRHHQALQDPSAHSAQHQRSHLLQGPGQRVRAGRRRQARQLPARTRQHRASASDRRDRTTPTGDSSFGGGASANRCSSGKRLQQGQVRGGSRGHQSDGEVAQVERRGEAQHKPRSNNGNKGPTRRDEPVATANEQRQ